MNFVNGASRLRNGNPSSEYKAWQSMRQRCFNPKCTCFKNYGARGITICDRWAVFANFLFDMGTKPSPKHTLERKDNNGNYEPFNCCWATSKEQNRNSRNTRWIEFRGERLTIGDWAIRLDCEPSAIANRLAVGWDIETALTLPSRKRKKDALISEIRPQL